MVNGALYRVPLRPSDRAVSGSCTALRNFQRRQHSCRQDGGDQFAVGHFYCRRLGVHLSWVGDLGGWWDETDFQLDTGFLLARLEEVWQRVPRTKPLSVGVVLLDLVPAAQHQPDLFAGDSALSLAMRSSLLTRRWREPNSNHRFRVTRPRFQDRLMSPLPDFPPTEIRRE
jgi:hypothetical protein